MQQEIKNQIKMLMQLFEEKKEELAKTVEDKEKFLTWQNLVAQANSGNEKSFKEVTKMISDFENEEDKETIPPAAFNASDGPTKFKYYPKTKWGIPYCFKQVLRISRKNLDKADNLTSLASIVATACSNPKAGAALASASLTIKFLKSRANKKGVFIGWLPAPIVPGGPGGHIYKVTGQK